MRNATKFFLMLLGVGLLVSALTIVPMLYEFQRVTGQVAREMAQLHAAELVGELEARIGREIALVRKMGATRAILDWMESPNDSGRRQSAFREFSDFNALLADHNSFVAVDSTLDIYFPGEDSASDDLVPSGRLDEAVEEDAWYFKTARSEAALLLNIDADRFLGSMRIWINMPVRRDGRLLGLLGTGLDLKPFLDSFFSARSLFDSRRLLPLLGLLMGGLAAMTILAGILTRSFWEPWRKPETSLSSSWR